MFQEKMCLISVTVRLVVAVRLICFVAGASVFCGSACAAAGYLLDLGLVSRPRVRLLPTVTFAHLHCGHVSMTAANAVHPASTVMSDLARARLRFVFCIATSRAERRPRQSVTLQRVRKLLEVELRPHGTDDF